MGWIRIIWIRLFGYPADSYYNLDFKPDRNVNLIMKSRPAYDPSTDEHKIMNGEMESYFE